MTKKDQMMYDNFLYGLETGGWYMGSLDPNNLYIFEMEEVLLNGFGAEHNGKEYTLYVENGKVVSFCWDDLESSLVKNEWVPTPEEVVNEIKRTGMESWFTSIY